MNTPKIRVVGASGVRIDPVATIEDLSIITGKFARVVEADDSGTVMRLVTAVGDLTASIQQQRDTTEEFADEVADVLIATFVAAGNYGLNGDDICEALNRRLTVQTSEAIATSVTNMLKERGLGSEAVALN